MIIRWMINDILKVFASKVLNTGVYISKILNVLIIIT